MRWLLSLCLAGCMGLERDGLTEDEWELARALGPLPELPADSTNRHADDPAAAALGQELFFETRWSGPLSVASNLGQPGETGKASCASCHDPAAYFVDSRRTNVSAGAGLTGRNTPTLINSAYFEWPGWGGKQDSHWTLMGLLPEQPASVLGGNRCGVAHLISDVYRADYAQAFAEHPLPAALDPAAPDAARFPAACQPKAAGQPDGAWELMAADDHDAVNRIMANVGKAFHAYQRRVVSGGSPLDAFLAGDDGALSAPARRGLKLFVGKAGCAGCHAGPLLSDGKYHNVAVSQSGPNIPATDRGREADLPLARANVLSSAGPYSDDPAEGERRLAVEVAAGDLGAYRTPGLRGVALTAPYFHTGGAATLLDVVEHYDRGGDSTGVLGVKDARLRPLLLGDEEKADLVAFLESLTGEAIPAELAGPRGR